MPTHRRSVRARAKLAVSLNNPIDQEIYHGRRHQARLSAAEFNPFRDLTKAYEQFNLPGLDTNGHQVVELARKRSISSSRRETENGLTM